MERTPRLDHSHIRIIGGQYRSRLISFPVISNLRPTPNRIRETLFNWLSPYIDGAYCLDLFAGSGALSFEAISRGAAYCLLLDACHLVVHALRDNIQRLKLTNIEAIQSSFPPSPTLVRQKFDIVFIDPPFHQSLVEPTLAWLKKIQCLQSGALVYIEAEAKLSSLPSPKEWHWLKEKKASKVHYGLLQAAIC